ncbi:mucin-5AC-like [Episyrphus balteatus]|uniref:mucin-5AC-like n=1 Tax=Episyrphus balteatus TaxID=286459 RepID=UPI002484F9D7|nr:mucin-5AC-like [Episyrphus balteatus]
MKKKVNENIENRTGIYVQVSAGVATAGEGLASKEAKSLMTKVSSAEIKKNADKKKRKGESTSASRKTAKCKTGSRRTTTNPNPATLVAPTSESTAVSYSTTDTPSTNVDNSTGPEGDAMTEKRTVSYESTLSQSKSLQNTLVTPLPDGSKAVSYSHASAEEHSNRIATPNSEIVNSVGPEVAVLTSKTSVSYSLTSSQGRPLPDPKSAQIPSGNVAVSYSSTSAGEESKRASRNDIRNAKGIYRALSLIPIAERSAEQSNKLEWAKAILSKRLTSSDLTSKRQRSVEDSVSEPKRQKVHNSSTHTRKDLSFSDVLKDKSFLAVIDSTAVSYSTTDTPSTNVENSTGPEGCAMTEKRTDSYESTLSQSKSLKNTLVTPLPDGSKAVSYSHASAEEHSNRIATPNSEIVNSVSPEGAVLTSKTSVSYSLISSQGRPLPDPKSAQISSGSVAVSYSSTSAGEESKRASRNDIRNAKGIYRALSLIPIAERSPEQSSKLEWAKAILSKRLTSSDLTSKRQRSVEDSVSESKRQKVHNSSTHTRRDLSFSDVLKDKSFLAVIDSTAVSYSTTDTPSTNVENSTGPEGCAMTEKRTDSYESTLSQSKSLKNTLVTPLPDGSKAVSYSHASAEEHSNRIATPNSEIVNSVSPEGAVLTSKTSVSYSLISSQGRPLPDPKSAQISSGSVAVSYSSTSAGEESKRASRNDIRNAKGIYRALSLIPIAERSPEQSNKLEWAKAILSKRLTSSDLTSKRQRSVEDSVSEPKRQKVHNSSTHTRKDLSFSDVLLQYY